MTTKSFINHRVLWLLIPLLTLFNLSAWAVDYTLMLTLDLASASDGSSTEITTDNGIKSFLQSAASATTDIKSASIDGGKIYDAKGLGGDGIPDEVLKIGTASGAGSFSFTIADSYDNVSKVVITGYGWKTTTAISINGSATQSPDTKLVERTFTYELGTASKTISVAVTASAFCATEIKLYKTTTPAAKYTVSFSTGTGNPSVDDRAESTAGGGITLPSVTPACSSDGWALYGWATSAVASSTTTAPTIVGKAGDTYKPSDDITLYAVYAKGEYTKITSVDAIDDGGKYIIAAYYNEKHYVMTNDVIEVSSEDYLKGKIINETTTNKYHAAAINAAWVCTFTKTSTKFYIQNASGGYIDTYYDSSDWYNHTPQDTYDKYTITYSSGSFSIVNSYGSYPNLDFFSEETFGPNGTSYGLLLYKQTSTPYYFSSPSCASCDANPSVGAASLNGTFLWTAYFIARKPFCRAA